MRGGSGVRGGVRGGRARQTSRRRAHPRPRRRRLPGARRALPREKTARVPRSLAVAAGRGLSAHPILLRPRRGRAVRSGIVLLPSEISLPALCRERLHTLGDRRGDGAVRGARAACPVRGHHRARHTHGAAGERQILVLSRGGSDRAHSAPNAGQCWSGVRRAAADRTAAPVRKRGRDFARRQPRGDGYGGVPAAKVQGGRA